MKNPFVKNGYLSPVASVNLVRVVSSDIPSVNKLLVDESVAGKCACEFMSGEMFKKRVSHLAEDIDGFILCLDGANGEAVMCESDMIVREFARRLCYILLTLKTGSPGNRAARSDWEDEHWNFWGNVEKVYLCGGMTHGLVGERMMKHMRELFEYIRFTPYDIEILPNSYAAGLEGAKNMLLRNSVTGMVFDFGHTYIKRGCFRGESLNILESIPSRFVGAAKSDAELFEMTSKLHDFIVDVIAETLADMGSDIGSATGVVFANYINNGALNPARGGYAKLSYLSSNYQNYLSKALSRRLNKPVHAVLIHDGTAAAMAVGKKENAAVITIGTSLGVGFVDSF